MPLIAGSIAIDNVITPDDSHKSLLGGSASYASLSAAFFGKPVHIVGIVGEDFPEAYLTMFTEKGVILDGIEHSPDQSFTWTGEYFDDMNRRETHSVGLNVLESWKPKVPDSAKTASICVLANMSPDNQLETLAQMESPSFVMADTMDLWIEIARDRLHEVLKKIDLLVINEDEAREFAETRNLVNAGPILQAKGPRFVVIKLGEYGALVFGPDKTFFRAAAYPLTSLIDPTGAGDSFLGGMAGYLASQNEHTPGFDAVKAAVVHGSVMASFTCEAFSTKGLESVTPESFAARMADLRRFTQF